MKTRKELKAAYKNKKYQMGVFQIKNTINGKIFIGSSLDLTAIWNRQKTQLKFGSHPNKPLQMDWNAFGEENFSYEILAEIKQAEGKEQNYKNEVAGLEELYLEEFLPFDDNGYNKRKIKK